MCNPVAFYAASAIITAIAGAGEASAQRQAGTANQQIAENNARLSDQAAQDAQNLGARESQQSTWRTRALIGNQRAKIAANGLDQDFGTPLDILGDTALFGGADRSAIAMDAARKAWGFQGEALNFRNQGAQANWMGKVGSQATILKTLGSVVGLGASAYGAAGTASTAKAGQAATSMSSSYFSGGGSAVFLH